MKRNRGSSLLETVVGCALFSVFMTVALGLFNGMTRTVRFEQQPAERLTEGRLAALSIARRIRNCQALVKPTLRQLLASPTQELFLRDSVEEMTLELKVNNGVLSESHFPHLYNPEKPEQTKPIKGLRLCGARELRISSGGYQFPTRVNIEITLTDGRMVRSVTNFREAI